MRAQRFFRLFGVVLPTITLISLVIACKTTGPAPANDISPDPTSSTTPASTTPASTAVQPGVVAPLAPASDAGKTSRAAGGGCSIATRMNEIVAGEAGAIACPKLAHDAKPANVEAVRKCVLDAQKAKKAFSALLVFQGIDSRVEGGLVGRNNTSTGAYETFQLHYDGCPMGCGDGDPHSQTFACKNLKSNGKTDAYPSAGVTCEGSSQVDSCP